MEVLLAQEVEGTTTTCDQQCRDDAERLKRNISIFLDWYSVHEGGASSTSGGHGPSAPGDADDGDSSQKAECEHDFFTRHQIALNDANILLQTSLGICAVAATYTTVLRPLTGLTGLVVGATCAAVNIAYGNVVTELNIEARKQTDACSN